MQESDGLPFITHHSSFIPSNTHVYLGKDALLLALLLVSLLVLCVRAFWRSCDRVARGGLLAIVVLTASTAPAREIELPRSQPWESVFFQAPSGSSWMQGDYEVWWLQGGVEVKQGRVQGRAAQAILWIKRQGEFTDRANLASVYLEGDVDFHFDDGGGKIIRMTDETWLGEFFTSGMMHVETPTIGAEPREKPPIFARGMARRTPNLISTPAAAKQLAPPGDVEATPAHPTLEAAAAPAPIQRTELILDENVEPALAQMPGPAGGSGIPANMRRVRVYPRNTAAPQAQFTTNPEGTETIGVITGGINFIIDGVTGGGAIDIYTDNMVVWTKGITESTLAGGEEGFQNGEDPLELYLEGNIVFKQGNRQVFADRMYYDVKNKMGVVLNAEMLTPSITPEELAQFGRPGSKGIQFNGMLRMKADVLQQLDGQRFYASKAWLSSSRMGKPSYRLQSGSVYFQYSEDLSKPLIDPATGQVKINPQTQEPLYEQKKLARATNNFLFLSEVPVLYWPVIATDLEKQSYYINGFQYKNDRVFGNQFLSEWDIYQILGIENPPPGTRWNLSLDYLSERGFGAGTEFRYEGRNLLGHGGNYQGFFDYWGINDRDTDNLGAGRTAITHNNEYRYRLLGRHRHQLMWDIQFTGEVGWIADRNFVEEYYQNEWDQLKDMTTGFELKKLMGIQSFNLSANTRLNDFFTETEQAPRGDHFLLGQPLFGSLFTWYGHSQASYSKMRVATTPPDPVDRSMFGFLPWEVNPDGGTTFSGEKIASRQEIDMPVQLGGFKVVPYALGELAHWGQDIEQESLQRAYGQLGIRASIPFWSVNPSVESGLFNVHGVAHKVVFSSEFAYTDANRDLDQLPLYDQIDDNSVEAFRRRFAFNTFGGPPPVPARFEERFYAVRSGLGSWVTSPSTEVVDDMMAFRFGARQRWQTKRGLPGQRRIIDWIVLDTNATWFPKKDSDNFGESLGLVDYDFRWHVGDRFTLLSSGIYDFFDQGQQLTTVGGYITRPPRGALYLGFHSLEGPINSAVLLSAFSYRMSPKWVSAVSTAVDVAGNGNIGQAVQLTRIGESFLVSATFNVDHSRNNVGAGFVIEPRFLPGGTTLGRAGGTMIPLAGLYGLE